ncbi:hypothetical protein SUDANB176_00638 [Streptomyces sp. enrichment culture]
MVRSRAKRRALSTQTAARLASSSARTVSSGVYASGWVVRTASATPSVVPRARSGTASSEWTPAGTGEPSTGSGAPRPPAHRSKSGSPARPSTALPSRSARAGGEKDGWTSVRPRRTAASGAPSAAERCATRRSRAPSTGRAGGSSAPRTQSSRSTAAKSANPGAMSSTSSPAVRTTSRVVPIRAAASFSSASRSRARRCSLLSAAVAVAQHDRPRRQGQAAGRRVLGEQLPYGPSHGLFGRVPGQPPGTFAPSRHDAAGIDDDRGGGVLHSSGIIPSPPRINRGRAPPGGLRRGGRGARRAPGRRVRSSAARCARPRGRCGPGR